MIDQLVPSQCSTNVLGWGKAFTDPTAKQLTVDGHATPERRLDSATAGVPSIDQALPAQCQIVGVDPPKTLPTATQFESLAQEMPANSPFVRLVSVTTDHAAPSHRSTKAEPTATHVLSVGQDTPSSEPAALGVGDIDHASPSQCSIKGTGGPFDQEPTAKQLTGLTQEMLDSVLPETIRGRAMATSGLGTRAQRVPFQPSTNV